MARIKQQPVVDPAVPAMRANLAGRIAALTPSLGENRTPVPGLALYRRITPTACFLATYEPSFTVFVQGRKRIDLNGVEYVCDAGSFLISSIDVPAQSQILEASEQVPMLSMFLRLDMPMVREVLSREDLPEPEVSLRPRGLAVGEANAGILGACSRLIDILATPDDIHSSVTSSSARSSIASCARRRANACAPSLQLAT